MAKANIMVVEDENIVAMDIKNILKSLGYGVSAVVSSGAEAIKKASETHPDLVLMDIWLKGDIDGVEAAEQIKVIFDIPVVYITAYADDNTLHRAKITEPYGYILKPFEEKELHTTIEIALYKHKMESKLKENEEWLATTLKSIGDAVIATDTKGYVTFLNPVAEALTGWKKEEGVGKLLKEVFNIINEETGKPAENPVKRILQEGVVVELGNNIILIAKDGTKLPIEDSCAPIKDDRGKILGTVLVFRDITERKKAEEELRKYQDHLEELVKERTAELTAANEQLQQEITKRKHAEELLASEKERLAVTLHSIGDGVITTDTEGNIVLINKVAENLTGWTQDEAIGKSLDVIFYIIKEKTRELCENPVEKVLKTGGIVGFDNHTVLRARDGTERILAGSCAPIKNDREDIIGVVLVFRDITEMQKMEEELLKFEKLESVGILAGGIAHDFNNILTAILGNINLAKLYTKSGDKVFERLIEVEKATLQAKNLTQQLLTFSKGGAPIKKSASISELLKDTAKFALSGSNVKCEFSIPDDLWSVEIDAGQISQVINNLIINADQAMPEGGIIKVGAENVTVGAKEVLPLKEGKYVKVSIEDQGIGIPKEYLQKIFDPYFTTKQKGSGLGLTTSYSIIKKHDGLITVQSEVGVGTNFCIYIPAAQKEIKKEVKKRPIEGKGKILVMDDEQDIREFLGEVLTLLGYDAALAKDGSEAIELYKKAKESAQPFDAVILDLTIRGGKGGEETIQKLIEIDPEIKAIVSSGYSNDHVMSDFRKYGFSAVITKPYTIEELSEILNKILDLRI
ncbi:MAG: PAS domain S-box protein [Methanosarcinales archaeon]